MIHAVGVLSGEPESECSTPEPECSVGTTRRVEDGPFVPTRPPLVQSENTVESGAVTPGPECKRASDRDGTGRTHP